MTNYVGDLIREAEQSYISGDTQISEHVSFSLKDNINRIDAYLNSKHISGETDSQGRPKPVFNIVTAASNIWYRATDIDRKNIRIMATKAEDYVLAFLATIHLQEFMRKSAFGIFLNDWGRTLARYGSAVSKFVEKEGELYAEVIPWNRLIADSIDFEANPKIEKLYFTPAQLKKNKNYDQDYVKKLLDGLGARENLSGETKDNINDYVEVYEVHGELPLSYLTDKETDEETYVQQMHVISFIETKEHGDYEDYTLYSGKEAKDPYQITHLIKEDGRSQAIGAVEHLFTAQWMVNHSVKAIKDQLDLASKLFFQTADGNFAGRNALTSMMNGDILIHTTNQPLTQLNDSSHDITQLQSFGQQWQAMGNQAVGVSEAMLGAAPKAGTAWRQTQAILQENHSLFELMTENKGLAIEQMMINFVIPFNKKKMDTTEEISATLEAHQITQLDTMYVPQEAIRRNNQAIKNKVLNGKIAEQPNLEELKATIQEELNAFGDQRFIKPSEISTKTWKEALKGLEWQVIVEVTPEQTDKQAILTTLQGVFDTIADPNRSQVLQTPQGKLLFNKIMNEVGNTSPIELNQVSQQPAMPINGGMVGNAGTPLTQLTQQQNA